MHYTRFEYFIFTVHNQECLLMMLQRQQSLSADAVEIALTKKRGTSDFVARGQLHCEFTASSGKLSTERAGWQASSFKLKWLTSS